MFNYFRKPTSQQLMAQELEDAQRQLLVAESGLDWAQSQVAYNEARVSRLKAKITPDTRPVGKSPALAKPYGNIVMEPT